MLEIPETIPLHRGTDLGWKNHPIRVGDGKGGWKYQASQIQFLHITQGTEGVGPFGLAQMDNGEIILLASWGTGDRERSVASFSRDEGATWSDWRTIPGDPERPMSLTYLDRPMLLAYLGKGDLTFTTSFTANKRFFSSDYGRTWPESIPGQPTGDGRALSFEGNPLVDRDARGIAVRMAEIGYNQAEGNEWRDAYVRWSVDGGRTWSDEVRPGWRWKDTAGGKTWMRGASEGSLVRAKNGWIVAAVRSDLPARYLNQPCNDNLEGLAVSISEDNGKTWSPLKILFDAGRHHAHLIRMPNGDIVMTMIVRVDVRDGKLASYRRGCDAIVSRDNGLTWDLSRRYILDEFEFFDGCEWYNTPCGHLSSVLLDDGSILTAYGGITKGVSMIRWKP